MGCSQGLSHILWAPASVLAAAVHGVRALGRAGPHCSSGPWAVRALPVPGVIHACTAVCAPAAIVPLPCNFPVHAVMVTIPCRLSHVCASAEMALMSHKSSLCMCARRHGPHALQTLCVHGSLCRASHPRAHATGAVFPGLCAPSTRTWSCHPALPKPPPWALTRGC